MTVLEARIDFNYSHSERGFRRSSVISFYQFLRNNDAQERKYVSEFSQAYPLNRDEFVDRFANKTGKGWNAKYSCSALGELDMESFGQSSAALSPVVPTFESDSNSSSLVDAERHALSLAFRGAGVDYLNFYWFRTDNSSEKDRHFSFVATACNEHSKKTCLKLEWLWKSFYDYLLPDKRWDIKGIFYVDGDEYKRFTKTQKRGS